MIHVPYTAAQHTAILQGRQRDGESYQRAGELPRVPCRYVPIPRGPRAEQQPLKFGTGYVTALRNSSAKHALHAHRRIRTRNAYRVLEAGDWVRMRDFRVLVCYGVSRVSESEWVSG